MFFLQIKLHEVVETSTKVYIILQLASKGDLLEYINNKATLSEDQVRILFCQLAAAMAYCHKEQVAHRDLKCENILIDGEGKLKVTGKNKIYYWDVNCALVHLANDMNGFVNWAYWK